jgi:hypothetical protein
MIWIFVGEPNESPFSIGGSSTISAVIFRFLCVVMKENRNRMRQAQKEYCTGTGDRS